MVGAGKTTEEEAPEGPEMPERLANEPSGGETPVLMTAAAWKVLEAGGAPEECELQKTHSSSPPPPGELSRRLKTHRLLRGSPRPPLAPPWVRG